MKLPPALERLALRVGRWPWWLIVIIVGLVIIFFTIANNSLLRRALAYVTDDPRIITDRFYNVAYEVKKEDGQTEQVVGTITRQDDQFITLIVKDEVQVIIPTEDQGKIACPAPDTSGACQVGGEVVVTRASISGSLVREDLGRYDIQTIDGATYSVRKLLVVPDSEKRTEPNCRANPDRHCQITVQLKSEPQPALPFAEQVNIVRGILKSADPAQVVVQTVPPVSTTINRANIVRTIQNQPAQCALNNLSACNVGIFLTFTATLTAFALASVAGLFLGLMRISSNPVLFNFSTIYVEVMRGIPLVVILLFFGLGFMPMFRFAFPPAVPGLWTLGLAIVAGLSVYYLLMNRHDPRRAVPSIGSLFVLLGVFYVFTGFLAANSNFSLEMRGVIGLAFGYAAYMAELFRAGIQSIPRGQMEAARSQGMTYTQAMRWVILPQAFRVVLPPLGNEFIAMLKDTSLLLVVAVPELTFRGVEFSSSTLRIFETYAIIGVLYLCMTLMLSFVVRVIERRTSLPR